MSIEKLLPTALGPYAFNKVHCGDALECLRQLPDECVQVCVTSPPYWGLRDYGVDGQLGLEKTPQEYFDKMTAVFEEVRRVLRKDGTLWLNMGDSYVHNVREHITKSDVQYANRGTRNWETPGLDFSGGDFKTKDLCGIPWRLAFALQAAGWYLRCDIIWSKPNPMPESVTDRPTKAHEYLFLLAKSARYYYDAEAIKEPFADERMGNPGKYKAGLKELNTPVGIHGKGVTGNGWNEDGDKTARNKRSVWQIATYPYPGSHFATFPPELVEPCILAGSRAGDVVLDPFAGSGTTGEVAIRHGRKFIGFDLNEKYCRELAAPRLVAAERGQTVEQYKAGQMTIFDDGKISD